MRIKHKKNMKKIERHTHTHKHNMYAQHIVLLFLLVLPVYLRLNYLALNCEMKSH